MFEVRLKKRIVFVTALAFMLLFCGCFRERIKVPKNLKGRGASGVRFYMSDFFKSPLTIVMYGGVWDLTSIEQLHHLEELKDKYRKKGINVVFLAQGEYSSAPLMKTKREHGYKTAMILLDERLEEVFGREEKVPVLKFVNSKGVVVDKISGYAEKDRIEDAIKRHLN